MGASSCLQSRVKLPQCLGHLYLEILFCKRLLASSNLPDFYTSSIPAAAGTVAGKQACHRLLTCEQGSCPKRLNDDPNRPNKSYIQREHCTVTLLQQAHQHKLHGSLDTTQQVYWPVQHQLPFTPVIVYIFQPTRNPHQFAERLTTYPSPSLFVPLFLFKA